MKRIKQLIALITLVISTIFLLSCNDTSNEEKKSIEEKTRNIRLEHSIIEDSKVVDKKVTELTLEKQIIKLENKISSDELDKLYKYIDNSKEQSGDDIYNYYIVNDGDFEMKVEEGDKSVFQKKVEGQIVWNVEFEDFEIKGFEKFGNNVIVVGETHMWSSEQIIYAYVAMVDDKGNILWQTRLENGYDHEDIAYIIPHEDKISVFTRADFEKICYTELDLEGNIIKKEITSDGNGLWLLEEFSKGYIAHMGSNIIDYSAGLMHFDSDGIYRNLYMYLSDEYYYYIEDIKEYSGKLYISGYSTPRLSEDEENYGRTEISRIMQYAYDEEVEPNEKNEELNDVIRNNYTAVLFISDIDTGIPEKIYTAQGAVGGVISHGDNGKLQWEVHNIFDMKFEPAANSFSFYGISNINRCSFNNEGKLLETVRTEEAKSFYR